MALNSSTSSLPSTVRTSADAVNWGEFSQKWRDSYGHFTKSYDPEKDAFKSVDQHHLESLISLLRQYGLDGLWDKDEVQRISMIWHFLDPWDDSSEGLKMLNQKFETATLSNGNTSLLKDLADYAKLSYGHLISAEDFQAYKPNPRVYNGAAKKLGFATNECALVAAHLGDLQAAKACGYQTIYIERTQEEAWSEEKIAKAKQDGWVDIWISVDGGGFKEVARRLGCSTNGKEV